MLALGLSAAKAEEHHPVLLAPGFQFSQVKTVCVMPLINMTKGYLELNGPRLAVIQELTRRGFNANAKCAFHTEPPGKQPPDTRFLLTVRVDMVTLVGDRLTASLFDASTGKEVWRDTAMPGFGGRYKNALIAENVGVSLDRLFESTLKKLMETFGSGDK
jgi:hypothetical protein